MRSKVQLGDLQASALLPQAAAPDVNILIFNITATDGGDPSLSGERLKSNDCLKRRVHLVFVTH